MKTNTRNIILLSIIALVILCIAINLSFTKKQPLAKSVATAIVTRDNLTNQIKLSAEFRPYQEVDLHAKVSGYLQNINVDIGDQVKTGQVIAVLDSDELKADVDRTQADHYNAKLEYDRINEVIKNDPRLLAQADLDNVQATYKMALASMERAQTLFSYTIITAPFDGVITKRYVHPGALIQNSTSSNDQTLPLVHLEENARLRLDFYVPEAEVPQIHVGTPVEVTIKAIDKVIATKVARISSKIDHATRTMVTEVDIENNDLRATPGMYAVAVINLKQKNDALTLPLQAVSMGNQPNVWLVNKQNEIEEVPVIIGLQTPYKIEILQGLKEGDQVIFGNRGPLSVGMKVIPKIIKTDTSTKALEQ